MTPAEFRDSADRFTKAYLEAALWSTSADLGDCETCESDRVQTSHKDDCCATCGNPVSGQDRSFQDLDFDIEDLAPETLDRIVKDCAEFQTQCGEHIEEDNRTHGYRLDCTCLEYAGHDFWLTRNGHGAGFWDGDWTEPAASILTAASKRFGECSLYLGDDQLIYGQ